MKKVILVDGNNLLFRSYYATAYTGNIMKNSKGLPTNAIYGFVNMINKIVNEEKPEYMMIAFDKGKTFRHDKYESYKEGRVETPDDLITQFPIAKEICEAMGIKYLEVDNYEADDIIGTYSKYVDDHPEFEATIISSDKDLLQLISDKVNVKLLKQTDHIRMDRNRFVEEYCIEPVGMIDLKALMGDSSDNIPGVKGIGEKTAVSLLCKYKTLDGVYENLAELSPKTREKLELDRENAYMSYDLATIYKEVPIDPDFEVIKYKGIDALNYIKKLEDLEFFSIIKKLEIDKSLINNEPKSEIQNDNFILIEDVKDFKITGDYALNLDVFGTNYHKGEVLGVAIYNQESSFYLPYNLLKENPNILVNNACMYTYDLKKVLYVFNRDGIKYNNCLFDTMVAAYLLNYNIKEDLSYLARIKGYNVSFNEDIFGKGVKAKVPSLEDLAKNSTLAAKFIYETKEIFLEELKADNADLLFHNIEMPLVAVLADMELTGIRIDKEFLEYMGEELTLRIKELEESIYNLSGKEFNISSPKQLGVVLFEDLAIPYPKKIKDDNYSTSKEILDKLVNDYEIVNLVLEYRTLTKIYSNYIIGLIDEIRDDGKIHTIYTQTLTRTGRLSSIEPNLQNIPIRTDYGRLIRKAFIKEENSVLLASDYSQIELRIFASLAGEDTLIEAFINNEDIHKKTASDIFKVPLDKVDDNLRRKAKAVNFGILYGISGFGLAEDLGIEIKEAKDFIDSYFNTYPKTKQYMNVLTSEAYKNGYVKTIMNRKRVIDELKNSNYMVKQQGERMALNTPIQGSSADILKKAMIEIYAEFKKRNLKSKMLLQVHDELVFNVLKDELKEVEVIIRNIMENTYELNVPLVVDITIGDNWYEAK